MTHLQRGHGLSRIFLTIKYACRLKHKCCVIMLKKTSIFIPGLVSKKHACLLVIQLFTSNKFIREVNEPTPVKRASRE